MCRIFTEEAVENASAVFLARATDKVSAGSEDIYEFAVVEVYEGKIGALTTVSTASDGASCGVCYEVGGEYLLFVSDAQKAGRAWDSGLCHGPNASSITEMREMLHRAYGPPRPPDASAPIAEISWWTRVTADVPSALIALAVALALGGLWWCAVIVRRRLSGHSRRSSQ